MTDGTNNESAPHAVEIRPFAIYRARELEAIFGRRGMESLRKDGGLVAIADRYWGEAVIDAMRMVVNNKRAQRALGGQRKGCRNDLQEAQTKEELEEGVQRQIQRTVRNAAGRGRASLQRQMAEIERSS